MQLRTQAFFVIAAAKIDFSQIQFALKDSF
jgi:hypothetical protein